MDARKKRSGMCEGLLKLAICQWKYDSEVHGPVTVNLNSEFLPLYPKCHGHMMQSTDMTDKIK